MEIGKAKISDTQITYHRAGWKSLKMHLDLHSYTQIFILTDANTHLYCLPYLLQNISFATPPLVLQVNAGEEYKTIDTCVTLWKQLSEMGADRESLIINLGGGVITDLGGFVASTYKRGLPFIHIPTSLLAMVDAAIGGKNGVDLDGIKNQVGVINPPRSVLIDSGFLRTLPPAHIISGYAEMLKHGLIYSEAYLHKVIHLELDDMNTSEAIALIRESIEIKYQIVSQDPEEKDQRKTLNYGHTLGHAIESFCMEHPSKETITHGEAVAVGMILATFISSELVSFPKNKRDDITATIFSRFPKVSFTASDIKEIIRLLAYDKKNSGGKVLFVLLEDIGKHKINCEVPNEVIHKAFDYYKNF